LGTAVLPLIQESRDSEARGLTPGGLSLRASMFGLVSAAPFEQRPLVVDATRTPDAAARGTERGIHVRPDRTRTRADPIRIHDVIHIIFPANHYWALASYLVALEGLWLWKKDTTYCDLYHFWSHIFAVNFAMGVVSGIVMAYSSAPTGAIISASQDPLPGRCSATRC